MDIKSTRTTTAQHAQNISTSTLHFDGQGVRGAHHEQVLINHVDILVEKSALPKI